MRIIILVNSPEVIIFSFFPFFLQYFETGSHIVSFKVS